MSIQYEDERVHDVTLFEPEPETAEAERVSEDTRAELSLKILKQVHESVGHVIAMMEGGEEGSGMTQLAGLVTSKKQLVQKIEETSGIRVLEGVFDGEGMVGSDGKVYAVPPNYASKSRLVEGDVMKLTIKPDGTFIYKQIGPVERTRVVGCLAFDTEANGYVVLCEDRPYRVLTASITYFRGEPGDDVAVFMPKGGKCSWAAVENIMKK